MLVLDSSDLVDVSLRNKSPLSGIGVTPTATTAAGSAVASTSTTACDGRELSSLGSSGFRFLATLGGHVKLHYAVKVRKLQTVDQDGIPSSIKGGVLDPFFKVMDLHALFKCRYAILNESFMAVVLPHKTQKLIYNN